MNPKRCFAVDLGASGGKCFAAEFRKKSFVMKEIHRFSYEPVSFFIPGKSGAPEERMYWDDTFIHANIIEGLRVYRREFASALDSIGIDAWGADGVFITPKGDLLGKMYAYRDHRLDTMITRLKRRISADDIYKITGIHFQPFNVSNQILWFAQNRADLLASACRFVPAPSLFYYFLCGRVQVDSTWASITQLMDAGKKKWSGTILARLGIPREVMPEIVKPGATIGKLHASIARAAGLKSAKMIAVGSHDTASAFAAAPVDNPGEALIISSGTWSLVGKLVPEPITTPEAYSANLSNEGGIGNVRLLKNCMGGWLVHELRRGWRDREGQEMAWTEIYRQAGDAKPFSAFIDPDDKSFYNPPDMEKAISDYCRRTRQTMPATRGGILRLVYESLAFKYRSISDDISRIAGQSTKIVHIVGGGSRNELLNQFTANAVGAPVSAGPVEATAVGNLMVQALGLAVIKSLHDALPIIKKAFPIKIYHPRDTGAWEQAFRQFQRFIRS
ncbi:MAG: rhamnulokinase [Kiritimatiellae bacterium]|nr:rhamnulokinase [Kiritimatiellia bacterium]